MSWVFLITAPFFVVVLSCFLFCVLFVFSCQQCFVLLQENKYMKHEGSTHPRVCHGIGADESKGFVS